MIYATMNSDCTFGWGIYKRKPDLNWTKFISTDKQGDDGMIIIINYALNYFKDAKILFGGYWFNHEQLEQKLYEILDNK